MVKIIHYTSSNNFESIRNKGFIELEGFNIEQNAISNPLGILSYTGDTFEKAWKYLNKQYKITGRYIWFTEENNCSCISKLQSFEKVGLCFNSQDIGAEKWNDFSLKLMFKNNRAKKVIRNLNKNAILNGDDVSKWWVCQERVDFKLGWEKKIF